MESHFATHPRWKKDSEQVDTTTVSSQERTTKNECLWLSSRNYSLSSFTARQGVLGEELKGCETKPH